MPKLTPKQERGRVVSLASNKKLEVSYRATESLEPYARNSRTHSERQVEQIAASITEFGFTQPILIDGKNGIIAGHGRVMAAKLLGMAEVPTIELAGLSAAQKRAYVIADNKLALNAGWDDAVLADELKALGEQGFDLALTGFDDVELVSFLTTGEGLTDPDEVPDAPATPTTVFGDVWVMGNHRIICGDSTSAEVVAALLGPVKPHLMVTDPPYGIGYSYVGHNDKGNARNADLVQAVFKHAPDTAVWTPGLNNLARDISRFGKTKVLVWSKKFAQAGSGLGGASTWEPILVLGKTPQAKLANDLIEIMTDREILNGVNLRDLHSCPKPVALFALLIEAFAKKSSKLYEPFSGSGTTVIAGEMTGRHIYAIELSPAYVDVAVIRWQAFTGQEATLEGDGRTFAEIAAQRAQEAA